MLGERRTGRYPSQYSKVRKLLLSPAITEKLLSSASIVFALGFFEVLQSATPPTVSFKNLPADAEKR
jgi:hypothetical protein